MAIRKIRARKVSSSKSASKSAAAHESNREKKSDPLNSQHLEFLSNALLTLNKGFEHLPEFKNDVPGSHRLRDVLTEAAERLRDNYPYFHPLYAG